LLFVILEGMKGCSYTLYIQDTKLATKAIAKVKGKRGERIDKKVKKNNKRKRRMRGREGRLVVGH
jgi:hypothetical protein